MTRHTYNRMKAEFEEINERIVKAQAYVNGLYGRMVTDLSLVKTEEVADLPVLEKQLKAMLKYRNALLVRLCFHEEKIED